MTPPGTPLIFAAHDAAQRLGISVASLAALVRKYQYEYMEITLGGKPGDRGRNRWGLTEAQIQKVLEGQRRRIAPPPAPEESEGTRRAVSPDGKRRIKGGAGRLAGRK